MKRSMIRCGTNGSFRRHHRKTNKKTNTIHSRAFGKDNNPVRKK